MPLPTLVKVPAPVPMMLARVPPVLPPRLSALPAPVRVPVLLSTMAPWSATMLLSLPNVIKPTYVAVVLLALISAPPALMPLPFKLSGLLAVMVVPLRSSTAPLAIDVPPVVEPSAEAFDNFNVPAPNEMVKCLSSDPESDTVMDSFTSGPGATRSGR